MSLTLLLVVTGLSFALSCALFLLAERRREALTPSLAPVRALPSARPAPHPGFAPAVLQILRSLH